jgi:hypothetical protein
LVNRVEDYLFALVHVRRKLGFTFPGSEVHETFDGSCSIFTTFTSMIDC